VESIRAALREERRSCLVSASGPQQVATHERSPTDDGPGRLLATPGRSVHGGTDERDEGTRFPGVQIGQAGHTGMHAVCDPVHLLRDRAALGGR
jgi:hypothetical protein